MPITLLYIDTSLDAWLSVAGNLAALPCASNGGLLRLPSSLPNFKVVYATLLAGHIAGKRMNVRLDPPNQAQCTVAWVSMP